MLDRTFIRPFLKHCQTDLFATGITHQLPTYISWRPDLKLPTWMGYAFLLFNPISRFNKLVTDKTEIVLIAPIWQPNLVTFFPLIVTFLPDSFDNGNQYRFLNVLRCILSATHPKLDGFQVGQHHIPL